MSTVRDLLSASLRTIGVLASGETATAAEQADGLSSLRRMLDSWSIEGLLVVSNTREVLTLTPSIASQTLGVGGDLNTERPIAIEFATILDGTIERPLDILNLDQWARIRQKSLTSGIPTKIYVEDTFPLATVYLWPTPSSASSLVLYSKKPLSTYASANTTVSLAPGYEEAIVTNLGVRLCPEYGKQASADLIQMAQDSKANVQRHNSKAPSVYCDPAVLPRTGFFNILTGE